MEERKLYTVKVELKMIVEAGSKEEAKQLADEGMVIAGDDKVVSVKPTTRSERVWFGLTNYSIRKDNK